MRDLILITKAFFFCAAILTVSVLFTAQLIIPEADVWAMFF